MLLQDPLPSPLSALRPVTNALRQGDPRTVTKQDTGSERVKGWAGNGEDGDAEPTRWAGASPAPWSLSDRPQRVLGPRPRLLHEPALPHQGPPAQHRHSLPPTGWASTVLSRQGQSGQSLLSHRVCPCNHKRVTCVCAPTGLSL